MGRDYLLLLILIYMIRFKLKNTYKKDIDNMPLYYVLSNLRWWFLLVCFGLSCPRFSCTVYFPLRRWIDLLLWLFLKGVGGGASFVAHVWKCFVFDTWRSKTSYGKVGVMLCSLQTLLFFLFFSPNLSVTSAMSSNSYVAE